uniref:Uncharacterized protein n=1 Tax=Arundo donax TaxID=35708 RepID=A0A0A9FC28_ARUDO
MLVPELVLHVSGRRRVGGLREGCKGWSTHRVTITSCLFD